jgi:hypothetical protein
LSTFRIVMLNEVKHLALGRDRRRVSGRTQILRLRLRMTRTVVVLALE